MNGGIGLSRTKALYANSLASSVAMGSAQPFIAVYAAQLGASPTELGLLHASMNFTTNAAQLIWGSISDAMGRRVPLLVAGGLLSAAIWPLALMTTSPGTFVLLMALRFAFYSMTLPTFTALIADVTEPAERTRVTVQINAWSTVGAAVATSTVAAVSLFGLNGYHIGFLIAMVAELASAVVLLGIREQKVGKRMPSLSVISEITANSAYLQYVLLNTLYILFMSIAWPLFTITVTRVARLDLSVIAALSVVSDIASIATIYLVSRANVDLIGFVKLQAISRAAFAAVPLVYGFTPVVPMLVAVNVMTGLLFPVINTARTLYLLAVVPVEGRATYVAIANVLQGISSFVGSTVGGALVDQLTSLNGDVAAAMIPVYLLSTVGRFVFGVLHFRLNRYVR
ncbi:MAG: MFS transporter [Nitrososphaerota archaeon]|nr:MFS transporter [Candidatus Calditenuis fumarioli]